MDGNCYNIAKSIDSHSRLHDREIHIHDMYTTEYKIFTILACKLIRFAGAARVRSTLVQAYMLGSRNLNYTINVMSRAAVA